MTIPAKPQRREYTIKLYVTDDEAKTIAKAAGQNGMSVSEFSRLVILESIRPTPHMDDIKKDTNQ